MIIQKPLSKAKLPVGVLCKMLGLEPHKTHYDYVDCQKLSEKLLEVPGMEYAEVMKRSPNKIIVKYFFKEPVALLIDYENTCVDSKGYIFPNYFNFDLPKIHSQEKEDFLWGEKIDGKMIKTALEILSALKERLGDSLKILMIDVSKMHRKSYGQREIVIHFEDSLKNQFVFPMYVRLSCQNIYEQLGNFLALYDKMQKDYLKQVENFPKTSQKTYFQTKVIDLRIAKQGLIQSVF